MKMTDDIELINSEPIVKDWEWWSSFLQREYYGAPEEMGAWRTTGASVAHDLNLKPGMRVLDLGSGCGELALQLALRGADVVGVEQSATLAAHCMQLARERGINATFVAADMFQFRPEGPVDAVISVNTSFGYGTDAQNRALIAKIGSWLSPGGAFYLDLISADTAEAFGSWNDTVAGGQFLVDNSYDAEQHVMTSHPVWVAPDRATVYTAITPEVVRLYDRAEIEAEMRAAGLEPRRLRKAMGRKFVQDDAQMLTTWIALKA